MSISSQVNLIKKYLVPITIVYLLIALVTFVGFENRGIFELKKEVLVALNETVNALLLLVVPFIFGTIAASARVMISGLQFEQNMRIIVASGLISSFSWLGIKSKVFIALLTPYIARHSDSGEALVTESSSEFYSMALVAVLVGAFASNLYIFVNQKVESLTNTAQLRNKSSNTDGVNAAGS